MSVSGHVYRNIPMWAAGGWAIWEVVGKIPILGIPVTGDFVKVYFVIVALAFVRGFWAVLRLYPSPVGMWVEELHVPELVNRAL